MTTDDRLAQFLTRTPDLSRALFVAPNATVVGDVRLAPHVSIWFQAVLRGDINFIEVGEGTNIQDGAIVHLADDCPARLGAYVTVGHAAIVHACTIGDECLVGMRAVVMDGATVGHQSIIGAGAVVTGGTQIPEGSLVLGSPAKVARSLTADERRSLRGWAEKYMIVARHHADRLRALA